MSKSKFQAAFKEILCNVPLKHRKQIILTLAQMAEGREDIEVIKTVIGKTFDFKTQEAFEDAVCVIIDEYPNILKYQSRYFITLAETLPMYAVYQGYEKVLCKIVEFSFFLW